MDWLTEGLEVWMVSITVCVSIYGIPLRLIPFRLTKCACVPFYLSTYYNDSTKTIPSY